MKILLLVFATFALCSGRRLRDYEDDDRSIDFDDISKEDLLQLLRSKYVDDDDDDDDFMRNLAEENTREYHDDKEEDMEELLLGESLKQEDPLKELDDLTMANTTLAPTQSSSIQPETTPPAPENTQPAPETTQPAPETSAPEGTPYPTAPTNGVCYEVCFRRIEAGNDEQKCRKICLRPRPRVVKPRLPYWMNAAMLRRIRVLKSLGDQQKNK